MPKVQIKPQALPLNGVAIKLTEDLMAEKGNYLVVDTDNESFAVMTREQLRANYGIDGKTHDSGEHRLQKHWTDFDYVILRYLQEVNEPVSTRAIVDGLKIPSTSYNRVSSRLQFLLHRKMVTRHGKGRGNVRYQITAEGKRAKPRDSHGQ